MVFSELKEPALNVATAALDQPGGEAGLMTEDRPFCNGLKRRFGSGRGPPHKETARQWRAAPSQQSD
jgi:hypothetical protein